MKINRFLKKLIGFKSSYNGTYRFKWGELTLHPKRWNLSFMWNDYDDWDDEIHGTLNITPLFFSLYIYTPAIAKDVPFGQDGKRYGIYVYDWTDINFCWGNMRKYWQIPYRSVDWVKTELLDFDMHTLYTETKENSGIKHWEYRERIRKDSSKNFEYTYTRKNGEVQKVTATVNVERITWKRKWWPFNPLVRTSINVSFDKEVGEDTGSWKGGCTGCGWDLKKGQTPEEALRDMEINRKFER